MFEHPDPISPATVIIPHADTKACTPVSDAGTCWPAPRQRRPQTTTPIIQEVR